MLLKDAQLRAWSPGPSPPVQGLRVGSGSAGRSLPTALQTGRNGGERLAFRCLFVCVCVAGGGVWKQAECLSAPLCERLHERGTARLPRGGKKGALRGGPRARRCALRSGSARTPPRGPREPALFAWSEICVREPESDTQGQRARLRRAGSGRAATRACCVSVRFCARGARVFACGYVSVSGAACVCTHTSPSPSSQSGSLAECGSLHLVPAGLPPGFSR